MLPVSRWVIRFDSCSCFLRSLQPVPIDPLPINQPMIVAYQ
uniref:Uncharacterized protein n=1 Tax=Picea glauca TaxID=3330 RepID=A0A101M0H9_PICGL|nr:hypothetical protein ABT39_MTgene4699 [Picea glauca]QHR90954.1 hypothetical protein Q903MT_gene4983 [Picea sitchensis]